MLGEADTCRLYVLPKLVDVGWDTAPHCFNEQKTFTDGRIVVSGSKVHAPPSTPHRLRRESRRSAARGFDLEERLNVLAWVMGTAKRGA